jgi:F-type H+-transporting ATPase subunit epsilon
MATLAIKIMTPERVVYQDTADRISVPTEQGMITVLPGHIPLIATIMAGEVIVHKDEKEFPLAISSGCVEVSSSSVMLLVQSAEHAEEIDEQRAVEAHRLAAELLSKATHGDVENYALLNAKLERELTRLKVVRKHRSSHRPLETQ